MHYYLLEDCNSVFDHVDAAFTLALALAVWRQHYLSTLHHRPNNNASALAQLTSLIPCLALNHNVAGTDAGRVVAQVGGLASRQQSIDFIVTVARVSSLDMVGGNRMTREGEGGSELTLCRQ